MGECRRRVPRPEPAGVYHGYGAAAQCTPCLVHLLPLQRVSPDIATAFTSYVSAAVLESWAKYVQSSSSVRGSGLRVADGALVLTVSSCTT